MEWPPNNKCHASNNNNHPKILPPPEYQLRLPAPLNPSDSHEGKGEKERKVRKKMQKNPQKAMQLVLKICQKGHPLFKKARKCQKVTFGASSID